MQRRFLLSLALAGAALAPLAAQAQNVLDEVMARKTINIAIPTDFPPYGYVGTDLKPQGLDIDMANYIGAKLGVKVERGKVIDFTAACSPIFQAVFAAKSLTLETYADLAGKTAGVTRGAMEDMELSKLAPPGADIKRFEDNNATVSAFVSGQVQAIATGASVAGNLMGRNPRPGTEYKLLIKDSPNFIGVGKGVDKLRLKGDEIIAAAKPAGDLHKMAVKWLGRPAGELPN
jgi:polar amino acid transport system substrate-binding protein